MTLVEQYKAWLYEQIGNNAPSTGAEIKDLKRRKKNIAARRRTRPDPNNRFKGPGNPHDYPEYERPGKKDKTGGFWGGK